MQRNDAIIANPIAYPIVSERVAKGLKEVDVNNKDTINIIIDKRDNSIHNITNKKNVYFNINLSLNFNKRLSLNKQVLLNML